MKISEIIGLTNEDDIHIDINDLDVVFSYEGFAYIKTIKCQKIDECLEEIKNFSFTPKGVIVEFRVNEEFPLIEIERFMEFIEKISDEDADIILGIKETTNEIIEINLIFTGLKCEKC